jgi:hypothetical protein
MALFRNALLCGCKTIRWSAVIQHTAVMGRKGEKGKEKKEKGGTGWGVVGPMRR